MAKIELATVIKQLREELQEAMQDADGQGLRFEVGPIELTLTVVVSREASAGAKARFYVFELGSEGSVGRESTQELRLTLTPRDTADRSGGPSTAVLVEGRSVAGES